MNFLSKNKKITSIFIFVFLLFAVPQLSLASNSGFDDVPYINNDCSSGHVSADNISICNEIMGTLQAGILDLNQLNGIENTAKDASIIAQVKPLNSDARMYYDKYLYVQFDQALGDIVLKNDTKDAQNLLVNMKQAAYNIHNDLIKASHVVGKDLNQLNNESIATANASKTACWQGVTSGIDVGNCINNAVDWIGNIFLEIFSLLLRLAGIIFDAVIKFSVVNINNNITAVKGIDTVWKMFRDLANLSFIFILLYVGVKTILDIKSADAKRVLMQIVIAAIFINFSLFIAKVLIDFSNIITLAFYNTIGAGGSISTRFVQLLGMSSLAAAPGSYTFFALLSTIIMKCVVMFIATFSFLAAAWLFMLRYVVIILLLLSSPIAFMGGVLPQLKSQADRWWTALRGQLLFPILYMFFIWVTVTVSAQFASTSQENVSAGIAAGIGGKNTNTFTDVAIHFVVLIVLLNAALILAKTQSGKVGGKFSKITEGGLKRIEGARKVTQGYMGRGTVRATGLNRLDNKFKKWPIASTRLGSYIQKNTTGLAAGAKFGSKHSVIDVDKDNKKLREDFAKEQDKEVQKEADKLIDNKVYVRGVKIANLNEKIEEEREKIARYDIERKDPNKDQQTAQENWNRANAQARVYNDQKNAINALPIEKIEATAEEKKQILKDIRNKKANELYSSEKMKADEERKKSDAARGLPRKVVAAVFNPLRLYRRLTEGGTYSEPLKEAAKSLRDKAKKGSSPIDGLKDLLKDAGVGGIDEAKESKPAAPSTPPTT